MDRLLSCAFCAFSLLLLSFSFLLLSFLQFSRKTVLRNTRGENRLPERSQKQERRTADQLHSSTLHFAVPFSSTRAPLAFLKLLTCEHTKYTEGSRLGLHFTTHRFRGTDSLSFPEHGVTVSPSSSSSNNLTRRRICVSSLCGTRKDTGMSVKNADCNISRMLSILCTTMLIHVVIWIQPVDSFINLFMPRNETFRHLGEFSIAFSTPVCLISMKHCDQQIRSILVFIPFHLELLFVSVFVSLISPPSALICFANLFVLGSGKR